jgi:hypothetical protein
MFPAINVARVGLRATPRAARVQVSANQMVARRWLNDNAGNRTDDKAKLVRRTLLVVYIIENELIPIFRKCTALLIVLDGIHRLSDSA